MIHKSSRIGERVFIGSGVIIDKNVMIGNDVFIGHNVVLRDDVTLGRGVVIGHNAVIEYGTSIERKTVIQTLCYIAAKTFIGSYVFMAPCVTCTNEWHISKWRNNIMKQILKGPTIGDGCRIGAKALIMPGVNIGENAVIGAGSIITKNIRARQVWHGETEAKYYRNVPDNQLIITDKEVEGCLS